MIVIINIFKFRKWFKYGLKSKHPTAARPERAEALCPGLLWTQAALPEGQNLPDQDCYGHNQHALKGQKLLAKDCYGHKQHALKGQKLTAQGDALGIMTISNAPCKGKSFTKLLKYFISFCLHPAHKPLAKAKSLKQKDYDVYIKCYFFSPLGRIPSSVVNALRSTRHDKRHLLSVAKLHW